LPGVGGREKAVARLEATERERLARVAADVCLVAGEYLKDVGARGQAPCRVAAQRWRRTGRSDGLTSDGETGRRTGQIRSGRRCCLHAEAQAAPGPSERTGARRRCSA